MKRIAANKDNRLAACILASAASLLVVVCLAEANELSLQRAMSDGPTVKTTRRVNRDNSGEIAQIHTTKESSITINQKMDEISRKNKEGRLALHSARRVTEVLDAHGDNITITESIPSGHTDFRIEKIVRVQNTSQGTITTTQEQKPNGDLGVVRRVTVTKESDGLVRTVVETPDQSGNLVVTQTIEAR